jgi:hypothetical protein
MNVTVKVDGYQQAFRALNAIGKAVHSERMNEVLYKGARTIAHYAGDLAPIGPTGNLKRSLIAAPARVSPSLPPAAFALVKRKIAPHLHLVSFGTKPHVIAPKQRKRLKIGGSSHPISGGVAHPGSEGNPFFERAVRDTRSIVRAAIREEMKDVVTEAARRTL